MYNNIIIEISDICNAKCLYCTTGKQNRIHGIPKGGFMTAESFSKGLDYLLDNQILSRTADIELYSWGEPFLNREINDIAGEITKRDMQYHISTNASVFRPIDEENLRNITAFRISISGFSPETYKITHDLDFEKVISNILKFAEMLDSVGKRKLMDVSFLTYKFNFHEIDEAKKFFNSENIRMTPRLASYVDFEQMQDFLNDRMSGEDKELADRHMFNNFLLKYRERAAFKSSYQCPEDIKLVFDSEWNLIPCDAFTNKDKLANLFNCDLEKIKELKKNMEVCKECKKVGQHYMFHVQKDIYSTLSVRRKGITRVKLYKDDGDGFSEKTADYRDVYICGSHFTIDFSKPGKNIKRIRFDPCQQCCVVTGIRTFIYSGGKRTNIEPVKTNADKVITKSGSTSYLFGHHDPWFLFELNDINDIEKIIFDFDIALLGKNAAKVLI